MIATGVNEEGYREILDPQIGNSESESSRSEFFEWLKDRGLRGVDLIIGLVQAIEKHSQGATWQRCQTYFIRNILDAAPKYMRDGFCSRRFVGFFMLQISKRLSCYSVVIGTSAGQMGRKSPKSHANPRRGIRRRHRRIGLSEPLSSASVYDQRSRNRRTGHPHLSWKSVYRLVGAVLIEIDEKRMS